MQLVMEAEKDYEALRRRTCWVMNWLSPQRRLVMGHYHQLMDELGLDDHRSFYNFLRITPELFHNKRKDTNYRKAIVPEMKLATTLRYFATGDSMPPSNKISE